MKNKIPYVVLICLNSILFNLTVSTAQVKQQPSGLPIFNTLEMVNGTRLIADSSIDQTLLKKEYRLEKPLWDKALAYLTTTRLNELAPGKYLIAGDSLFALVTENPLKTPETAKWESHRKYIDLQCVISGAELIQVSPLAHASVSLPYDESKDLANYETSGVSHLAGPGRIFVFFSKDVHKPNLQAGLATTDKKIVIKIQASAFH